jgi:hypothetical protein
MKKLALFALFLVLGLSACKKDDVDPAASTDWATVVDGTYAITQVTSGSTVVNLPSNGGSGQVTFTRTAANQSTMRILIAGSATPFDQSVPVYLTGSGNTVDLYMDANHSSKYGTATRSSVNLTSGATGTITAAR